MDTGSEDDENAMLDSSEKASLPLPAINDKNFVNNIDFKENFLRLTSMVRRVYFSYLYKSLHSNYAISCTDKNKEDYDCKIKNCASQMELFAVRSALETSLYRKAMLKMISEVKEHTNEQKLYKSLISFLISPPEKSDAAIQTDDTVILKTKNSDTSQSTNPVDASTESANLSENIIDSSVVIKTEPLFDDVTCKMETQIADNELFPHQETPLDKNKSDLSDPDKLLNGTSLLDKSLQNLSESAKAEDSQDSLFQTMEDMFCESDDSSDLMTLIEKHSSTPMENSTPQIAPNVKSSKSDLENKVAFKENKRKRSSSRDLCKAKKRSVDVRNSPVGFNELKSAKYRKKVDEIWLVERVHQTSKLKSTMLEISLLNYRKYGRVKDKFKELFGEEDDEEEMPESPVCIEEHLQACKERIAPWIVKHLTPFYTQKRISSRELFKTICRHITDMLIINDTFPDETSIENYMRDFFKNKKSINSEADIYL